MAGKELDPILIQVTIALPIPMIYRAFIEPKELEAWLCDGATVDPRVGGRYVLRFDDDPIPFTSSGEVTHLTTNVDLGFTWQAPPQFSGGLSSPTGRSDVYVRLQESPEGIDVTLEHGHWNDSDDGAEARSWHFHLWDARLVGLKEYLVKAAFG